MSEIIDINITQIVDEVTIIATPTNYIVNIIKNTGGGGGGSQTLAETLLLGNLTGATNIKINNASAIELENTSLLKKGTYDFGAQGGISRICGVGFEDMWQAGIRHVFDGNGFIRNSTNCFNIIPDTSFDITLRFKVGSIWTLDDGTNYICTDATTGAAVWELYNVIPDAQVNSDWNATSGKAEILNKPTIPSSTNFVPYTGATSDVNLGEFGVQLGNIEFDLTPTNAPTGIGSMVWNDTAGTLDLKLKGGNTTLQIGQETVARVVNKTATNITLLEANYQAVRVTGAQGQRPKVDLAQANNNSNSTTTLGLVTETILNNQEGFITTSGQVQQINTTGSLQGETWADGDILYLSGTVAGRITNIKPIAPIHTVIIGFVEYAHAINGKIFVKVDTSYELDELHNVSAIAPNNNEVLTYDTPTLLWKPKTVISALGYTPIKSVIKDTVQGSTVTGVTTKTLTGTYLIPANTYNANDIMKISSFLAEKTGTAGTCTIRVEVGTTNVFSSATLLASHASAAATLSIILQRSSITLRGGNIKTVFPNGNILTDIALFSSALSSITFNPAIDNYIFTSLQLSVGTDSAFQSNFIMTN
jgi:hypothetical protein